MARNMVAKIDSSKPQIKVVTLKTGETIILRWSKALQQYVAISIN